MVEPSFVGIAHNQINKFLHYASPGTRAGGGSVESETHIYPHMCRYIVYILEQSLKLHVLLKWQYSHNAQCTCYPGYGLDEPVLGPPAAGSNAHLV